LIAQKDLPSNLSKSATIVSNGIYLKKLLEKCRKKGDNAKYITSYEKVLIGVA
jgi:hypothetical protein